MPHAYRHRHAITPHPLPNNLRWTKRNSFKLWFNISSLTDHLKKYLWSWYIRLLGQHRLKTFNCNIFTFLFIRIEVAVFFGLCCWQSNLRGGGWYPGRKKGNMKRIIQQGNQNSSQYWTTIASFNKLCSLIFSWVQTVYRDKTRIQKLLKI
jgi:hypothetical protein